MLKKAPVFPSKLESALPMTALCVVKAYDFAQLANGG
jgi:hypothetical protein